MVGANPEEGVFRNGLFLHPGLGFAIAFPANWQTQNTRQAVGAASPQRDAVIVFEGQGRTENPQSAARRWTQANRVQVAESAPARIGGWPAFRALARAQSQQGSVALDITWIAHPKGTYRLTAMTSPSSYRNWAPTFERVAGSFRALSADERASAKPLRLRVAGARAGETLSDLDRRSGNRWKLPETAVANGIAEDARLQAGQLVKVALESAR
jgi:predicted Zn-dependent protease